MRKTTKILISIFSFLVITFFLTGGIKGMSIAELEALIVQLQQQINDYQIQLQELKGVSKTYSFDVNLKYGDRGQNVKDLQEVLILEGFTIPSSETNEGYFGEHTASAVVGFQNKYADEVLAPWGLKYGTGFVGSSTRAKLNELYGGETTSVSSKGISAEDTAYGKMTISHTELGVGEKNRVVVEAQDDQGISEIKVSYHGTWHVTNCGGKTNCTASHYIIETSPGIYYYNGFVYGKRINGETEAVKTTPMYVRAIVKESESESTGCTDSDNGDIYVKGYCEDYRHINDGWDMCSDGVYQGGILEFYCSYDQGLGKNVCGTEHFKCPNGCRDGACIREGEEVEPSITVLSPNGGERFKIGNRYEITWKFQDVDKIDIELELWKGIAGGPRTWLIAEDIAASSEKYVWLLEDLPMVKGGPILAGDNYKLRIVDSSDNSSYSNQTADSSDNYFSIIAGEEATFSCADSDGGKSYYTIGTITEGRNGQIYNYTDYCYPGGSILAEYYCADQRENFGVSEDFVCPNGCRDGACIQSTITPETEDPITGALSVNKTSVNTGENITLTISAQDNQGVYKVLAFYQGNWYAKTCGDAKSCTKTFTFAETIPGDYAYKGYLYGRKVDGSVETSQTNPYSVRVEVNQKIDPTVTGCTDSDNGDIYVKGYCEDYRHVNDGWDMCSDGVYQGGLLEYVCDTDSATGNKICGTLHKQCPNGCRDGACIKAGDTGGDTGDTGETTQTKTLSLIYPDAPGYLRCNDNFRIRWDYSGNTYSSIDILIGGYNRAGDLIDDWKIIAPGIKTSQKYFYWTPCGAPLYIPSTFSEEPYKYKVMIREASGRTDALKDYSKSYFEITGYDTGETGGAEQTQVEDLPTGTLSTNTDKTKVGLMAKITIEAQDDQGVHQLSLNYKNKWYNHLCNGATTCKKEFTIYESESGTYYYYGYVYGKNVDGTVDGGRRTIPSYVRVIFEPVSSEITPTPTPTPTSECTDSDNGDIYVKGYCEDYRHVNDGWDMCSDAVYQGGVLEFKCTYISTLGKNVCGTLHYSCPNGCRDGACIKSTSQEPSIITSIFASIRSALDALFNLNQD